MRKFNKYISILLSVIMLISIIPITASAAETSGTCGDNVTWSYDSATGALTVSGTGEMYDCFCNGLTGPLWWYNYHEDITAVYVEEGVTYIGKSAFSYLDNLTKVLLPDSLTEIGDTAFKKNKKLTKITIPKGVSSIALNSFQDCNNLEFIEVDDENSHYSNDEYGVLFNKDKTEIIEFPMNNAQTNYNVPSSVKKIGQGAFAYNRRLLTVTLGESVEEIGNSAFHACVDLRTINIPDEVTSIQAYTFSESEMLTSVKMGDSVKAIDDGAFLGCASLKEITLSKNLLSIGALAFEDCWSLTSITIPDSVTTIGRRAFRDSALQEIKLGNSVETIGDSAFSGCDFLSVTLPDSVKNIGESSFAYCRNLETVHVGNGVETICEKAFEQCRSLTGIFVKENNNCYSSDGNGVLYNKDKTTLVFYPLGNPTEVYRIPEGVTTIGSYAFYCGYPPMKDNIYALIFPESLTMIEWRAFYNCTGPARIYFEGSKEQWEAIDIGGGNDSVNDARVYFDFNGVITQGYAYTSGDFEATTTLDINTGTFIISGTGQITDFFTIGGYLDHFSPFIKTLVIGDGITLIDQLEFSDFSNLETVILPQSITNIHKEAFEECPQIKDVYYSGTEEQWKAIAKAEFPNATIHYNCCETHNYIPVETKAICTVPGKITYVCASCEAHYVYEYIKPIGYHSYTQTEVQATCTDHGYTKYTCDSCGVCNIDYTANPTGHSFNEDGVCEVCGEKEVSTNHINNQMLTIESVLAMVLSFLSKLFGIFTVA